LTFIPFAFVGGSGGVVDCCIGGVGGAGGDTGGVGVGGVLG